MSSKEEFPLEARLMAGSDKRVRHAGIRCAECGKEEWRPCKLPGLANRIFHNEGWRIGSRRSQDVCPECQGKRRLKVATKVHEVVTPPCAAPPATSVVALTANDPRVLARPADPGPTVKAPGVINVSGFGTLQAARNAAERWAKGLGVRAPRNGHEFRLYAEPGGKYGWAPKDDPPPVNGSKPVLNAEERVEQVRAARQEHRGTGKVVTRAGAVYERKPDRKTEARKEGPWLTGTNAGRSASAYLTKQMRARGEPGKAVAGTHYVTEKRADGWWWRELEAPMKNVAEVAPPKAETPKPEAPKAEPKPGSVLARIAEVRAERAREEKGEGNVADGSMMGRAEPPRLPTRQERRKIMDRLADVYDSEKVRYRLDLSDRKVAEDLKVPWRWVADVRTDFFGDYDRNEASDEERKRLTETLKLAEAARDELLKMATRAEEIMGGLRAKLEGK